VHDATSRIFGLLVLLIAVWVGAYWLHDPSRPARVTRDERPRDPVAPPPPPSLPEPRSLARAEDPLGPEPRPAEGPPGEQPAVVVVQPEFDQYTVQPGDRSLQDIAQRFYGDRAKWEAIASANPFFSPDRLKPGVTVLRIPRDPTNIQGRIVRSRPPEEEPPRRTPTPDEPGPATGWRMYTVQENDTLWGIARKMYGRGTLTGLIADANRDVLPDPDRLRAGVVLRIPPAPTSD
jgi:nucleoid-associated protein YgaU